MSSLGLDITPITFMVSRSEFDSGDLIVFILPEVEVPGRTSQTISALEGFFSGLRGRGLDIKYDFLRISDVDYIGDLIKVFRYVNGRRPDEVIVWALGGTRFTVSLLTMYSILDPRVRSIFTYSESRSRTVYLRTGFPVDFGRDDRLVRVISFIRDRGGVTYSGLAEGLKIDQYKAYRIISRMDRLGLIDKRRGRIVTINVSKLGELYIEVNKAYRD